MSELSHLDDSGRARMVDVGAKDTTDRVAVADATVEMEPATAAKVAAGDMPKGDVVSTARIAGIQAAKRTAELIPLCHPLPLSYVDVAIEVDADAGLVRLTAEARTTGQTGVEMEAMTACSVAALTVYDMVKGVERGVRVGPVQLVSQDRRPPRLAPRFVDGVAAMTLAAVLTVSTSRAQADDASGDALEAACREAGLDVVRGLVSDDRESIAAALRRFCDDEGARFVFTTGGTGLTIDDVTPEATRDVIDREAPGYAEAIRANALRYTPMGLLTRGVSGTRGRTLIINFPGNPKAIGESWPVVEPTLEHAAQTLER